MRGSCAEPDGGAVYYWARAPSVTGGSLLAAARKLGVAVLIARDCRMHVHFGSLNINLFLFIL